MRALSKSQYVRGQQCLKSLWLYRHHKDLQDPVDMFQQSIFDSGTEFGKLAMQRFPGGTLIDADHAHPEQALAQTAAAMSVGAKVLYEAAFLYDDVLVRVDVLLKIEGGWRMVEVKSATKVQPVYIDDVAIQRHVLAGAGLPLLEAYVMHANPGYVRQGELNLRELFTLVDVWGESSAALARVPGALRTMKAVADGAEAPPQSIGAQCAKPYQCDFEGHCWAKVPEYSVFNIPYAKIEKKLELYNKGIQRVHQVDPKRDGLTDKRSVRAVEVARLGKAVIDIQALSGFLNTIHYPVAHLDFETDNPVVPPYDGLRPYQAMPFQASVRVQQQRGGPVVAHAYLGDGLTDPRGGLIEFLCDVVPQQGSLLAYYKPFEAGRLTELATTGRLLPAPQMNRLVAWANGLQDLADPFSKNWYTHPGFLGKWSIKNVLPVLVPSLTYKGLEIADGGQAMAAYAKLRDPQLPAAERARLSTALLIYCGQDTLAMEKILDHLYAVAAGEAVA